MNYIDLKKKFNVENENGYYFLLNQSKNFNDDEQVT